MLKEIVKLKTGIPGFDTISNGGLPYGRTTLVAGTAGSAKTVFAAQFLAEGIQQCDEPGVFVTFEETPYDICRNVVGFDWDVEKWVAEGKWLFVDASLQDDEKEMLVSGSYDLGALIPRIEYAIKKVGARRLAIDSISAVLSQYSDTGVVRDALFRLVSRLKALGITTIMTAERMNDYGPIARFSVEEYVADNVIILRNILEGEKRRRTIEILKYRGTDHQKGEYAFVINENGIIIIPLFGSGLKQRSSNIRVTSGVPQLDQMCEGGFFRDSVVLVSGATGTGKTLLTSQFIAGGTAAGQRALLFAFEESRDQLYRNARGWGFDFEGAEDDGILRVECAYPETAGLEEHLVRIKEITQEFKPDRIAIDSLTALERISSDRSFREFVIALTSFIKDNEIVGLFTSTTPSLIGDTSVTQANVSTLTDTIILLRYVESAGQMRRGITVLKMRGSMHEKAFREFSIDYSGMHIGDPFLNVTNIITG